MARALQGDEPEAAPRKKAKKAATAAPKAPKPTPQELEPGAAVLYWDGWPGFIQDAFEVLDTYWVTDEETGQVVRDEDGEIVTFKSADLKLVAPPPKVQSGNPRAPEVGVLIVGTSRHMMKILEHFGAPDPDQRTEPQELLAIPCSLCDPGSLMRTAREGVNTTTVKLAQEQRPDLHVGLRVYHIRHAVEQCVPLLRLEDFFCLAGVTVPFSMKEIKEGADKDEKQWRRAIANQLDVGVTAYGRKEAADMPLLEAAQQTLGKSCGMCLSDVLWQDAAQSHIRKSLGLEDLPLHFADSNGAQIYVVVLPKDASITDESGIISFHESLTAPYANLGLEEEEDEAFGEALPLSTAASLAEETQGSAEPPLPLGWTKETSKTTGKTYYFNAAKRQSTFVRPVV